MEKALFNDPLKRKCLMEEEDGMKTKSDKIRNEYINLYPTKDAYAGLLNSSAYPMKYPYLGLRALRCCCVSFSETHCTIRATFFYIPVW
jgi:hypothetical protein